MHYVVQVMNIQLGYLGQPPDICFTTESHSVLKCFMYWETVEVV